MRYGVLSPRAIWAAAAVILLVGVGVAVWLLLAYGHGGDQARNQLEAIKTAGTVIVGTGGAAALLLAARRQRATEIALKQKDRDQAHQERVATATEKDAAERRVTELYAKAADQLGSDKAPVRLAGLYALERLAQINPEQRQTIVNLLCAYLRMPFHVLDEPPDENADEQVMAADREWVQEREVRLAIQCVLAEHLRFGDDPQNPASEFWNSIDINLTGATLIDLNLFILRDTYRQLQGSHIHWQCRLLVDHVPPLRRFPVSKVHRQYLLRSGLVHRRLDLRVSALHR